MQQSDEDEDLNHWGDQADRWRVQRCRQRLLQEADLAARRRIVWQWIKSGDIDLLQFKPLIPLLMDK